MQTCNLLSKAQGNIDDCVFLCSVVYKAGLSNAETQKSEKERKKGIHKTTKKKERKKGEKEMKERALMCFSQGTHIDCMYCECIVLECTQGE